MDVTMASSPEEKVRLFRAMFRGREDVYARRYVSAKSGKSGYSPVCSVEWTRGVCDKKRVACAVCPNRRLEPLDDDVVRRHLRGVDAKGRDFTLGSYPLLADDTVRFAAIDFDKASWRADSASVCDVSSEWNVAPCATASMRKRWIRSRCSDMSSACGRRLLSRRPARWTRK